MFEMFLVIICQDPVHPQLLSTIQCPRGFYSLLLSIHVKAFILGDDNFMLKMAAVTITSVSNIFRTIALKFLISAMLCCATVVMCQLL